MQSKSSQEEICPERNVSVTVLHIANLLDVEVSPKDMAELSVSFQGEQH
jgi:hypothetical protein